METKRHIQRLLVPLLLPLLAACSMMHEPDWDDEQARRASRSYLTVTIGVSGNAPATRTPNGGEDGDGRERGHDYENAVSNVTLLLYRGNGVNNAVNTPIEHALYFTELTPVASGNTNESPTAYTRTISLPGSLDTKAKYHVLAIVNAGNLTDTFNTLGDVQNHVYTENVWTENSFVMASAEDATLSFDNANEDGSEENPYTANITVERLAARIDIVPGLSATYNETDGSYTYSLDHRTFVLQSITPINCLSTTSGSYLLKRVATATSDATVTILGKEEAENNASTNYVLTPYTTDRSRGIWEDWDKTTVRATNYISLEGEKYYILGYTLENTHPAGTPEENESHITGVQIKGRYEYSGGQTEEVEKTYYIRHSDPEGTAADDTAPMKYGIVRNNIYRLTICPTDKGLQLKLNVKPWREVEHSEIIM